MWTCNVLKCARFAKISPNVVFASTSAPWWDIGETRVNIIWGCSFILVSTKNLPSHHLQELFTVIILNHAQVSEAKGKYFGRQSSTSYLFYVKYKVQGFEHDLLARSFATATINVVGNKIGKWRCVI